MSIEKRSFGTTRDGQAVDCYTLSDGGIEAEIITYGGTIRALTVPVPGGARDVSLGFDDIGGYEAQTVYFGMLVGRVAGRISDSAFTLGGTRYQLSVNNGPNCLHGGFKGFSKRVWAAEVSGDTLWLSLYSPDGEEGFPGNLSAWVGYTVKDGALTIEYRAESDADTPLSLTNHAYFNLNGHGVGGIGGHSLQIYADTITESDDALINTGEILDVSGTPYDLREGKVIGDFEYDINFILGREVTKELRPAAVLRSEGLEMECLTTETGIQLYTGNTMSGDIGKGGAVYSYCTGLCLETQAWPNAINRPNFPSCVLRKGEVYQSKTVYRFSSY